MGKESPSRALPKKAAWGFFICFLMSMHPPETTEVKMTVLEAVKDAETRLAAVPDPRLDAEYLLAHVLGLRRLDVLLQKRRELTAAEESAFSALISRRAAREPLQYILGNQPFMGLLFHTDPRALIPRNDTETLCEEALRLAKPRQKVLDMCTGSGAIAVAMKKLGPGLRVTAADVSEAALSLARENAKALGAEIDFRQGDLWGAVTGEVYDMILCNPPYIPQGLREELQEEVKREPALALFGGADGLDFYRRIAAGAPEHLTAGGYLLLEIGDDQFDAVRALLAPGFDHITLLHDMNGRPRVARAERNCNGSAV